MLRADKGNGWRCRVVPCACAIALVVYCVYCAFYYYRQELPEDEVVLYAEAPLPQAKTTGDGTHHLPHTLLESKSTSQREQETSAHSLGSLGNSPGLAYAPCGWREEEGLVGTCPGMTFRKEVEGESATIELCAKTCCDSDECVSWQFRPDKGCMHTGDVRLGMEKDGPVAWCEPVAPAPWQGEKLVTEAGGERIAGPCDDIGWNPGALKGQCFGLGAEREGVEKTADACRKACCADPKCETWQFREDKGCFYAGYVRKCEPFELKDFEPFVGRRKDDPKRTYTDMFGAPWKQGD